jgi:hypothetical protein
MGNGVGSKILVGYIAFQQLAISPGPDHQKERAIAINLAMFFHLHFAFLKGTISWPPWSGFIDQSRRPSLPAAAATATDRVAWSLAVRPT